MKPSLDTWPNLFSFLRFRDPLDCIKEASTGDAHFKGLVFTQGAKAGVKRRPF